MPKLKSLRIPILAAALIGLYVSSLPVFAGEIHDLTSTGSVAAIGAILDAHPFQVNAMDTEGLTPLHWACKTGQLDAARLLMSRGAIINARSNDGSSPIHIAAESGYAEITTLLIESGARVNAMNTRGRTALLLARAAGRVDVAEILVANGGEERAASNSKGTKSVRYFRKTVRGCPVDAVYANLNNPEVKLSTAIPKTGVGKLESFGSYMKRLKPTAAINGTFFSRDNNLPIGDIVIRGTLAYAGGMGTAICVTVDNKVCFRTPPRWVPQDWSEFDTVVSCGPRLVANSRVVLNARSEGFKDPHVLGSARRSAVGLTYQNRLLLVTTKKAVTLTTLAYIMKILGCTDAINFDGGSSSAMYYRGKSLTRPSSGLANVLVVYE